MTTYPKKFYIDESKEPLLFHILSVGEGLMILLVFPDKTTMLYDCNVREEDKDSILEYLRKHIPYRYDSEKKENSQYIDIFANSHRDLDHYRGLSFINAEFPIKSIWDSGQAGENTKDADYKYYMQLRRTLIEKYGEESVIIPNPSISPIRTFSSAEVYCLCSSQDFIDETEDKIFVKEAKVQHTNAIVLSIHYGGRSILLTSDSDWKAWKEEIVQNFGSSGLLRTNILIASHHGSRSFFTDETINDTIDPEKNPDTTFIDSINFIRPSITLISCADYEQAHHPNAEALKIYKENTANQQVYTTHEKDSFVGFIDNCGNWTVTPIRFTPAHSPIVSFDIKCKTKLNGSIFQIISNQNIPLESELEFSIESKGGLIDPYESVSVWWEVSNGGINDHHEHQEIYYKGTAEKEGKINFKRLVTYEGKHLLRCRIKNTKKKHDLTRIFIVNGVK